MTIMNSNGLLATAERNNYFYGLLMDVAKFRRDQTYFNQKRQIANRLLWGSGVVCGLDVLTDPDTPGMVVIGPGLAIDGRGCEILVPEPEQIQIDPHQLTDEQGNPAGDPINAGQVDICLAYAEVLADPVPVLVPDCDTQGNCAYSTIREEFRIFVRQAVDDLPAPPTCTLDDFPLAADGSLHALLCERINEFCPSKPSDSCVWLARVDLDNGDIDACTGRRLVYGNALHNELLLCLAQEVQQIAGAPILRYVSGDGQSAAPGEQLNQRIVVEVVDGEGGPRPGVGVQFEVVAGDGMLSPEIRITNQQGRARSWWRLGPVEGEQEVRVSAAGTALPVRFRATAVAP